MGDGSQSPVESVNKVSGFGGLRLELMYGLHRAVSSLSAHFRPRGQRIVLGDGSVELATQLLDRVGGGLPVVLG
jgi:hypothetical protein